MSSRLQLDVCNFSLGRRHLVNAYEVKAGITVWTVVQTVLTATFNSYGNRQISTPYKIYNPEPIEKKFGTVDYVREGTRYTKFGTIISYLFIPFSQARAQVRPVDGFLRAISQKTWNHARMCLFGLIKTLFIPKTIKFWPKTGLTENA